MDAAKKQELVNALSCSGINDTLQVKAAENCIKKVRRLVSD